MNVISDNSGHRDYPPAQSGERLVDLMADYHQSLLGRASFAAADAGTLDADSQAAFGRAQRVLERLTRVRKYFGDGDSTRSTSSSTNGRAGEKGHAARNHQPAPDTGPASDLPKTFGRFEVQSELGHGGLGVVFLACDPLLGRQVALKIPRPDALFTRDLRLRFSREAQAAARLTHPNLVPVYEVGLAGAICYIASAYCEGPDLAAWLRTGGQQTTPKQAAQIVAALADAMHYAHSRGVLHRDLKPSNVLLEPLPVDSAVNVAAGSSLPFTPRITDFGLAKISDAPGDETCAGSMLGTPSYMAPEQAEGQFDNIDGRTDVYGLGAILYELLAGRAPFVGRSDADTVRRLLSDDAKFSGACERSTPQDLTAICLKCLEKRPSSRYQSAGELANDLRRFLRGEPTMARPAGLAERLSKWVRRRPLLATLVAVSVLAAATITIGSAVYSRLVLTALEDSERSRLQAVAANEETEKQRQAAEESRNQALRERDANEQFAYAGRMQEGFQSLAQGDVAQLAKILAQYDVNSQYAGLRSFEWHYLQRSLQADRMILRGHEGEVYSVAYSPDGQTLVSGGQDGTIRLWHPHSGQPLRTIPAHTKCANQLEFTKDGHLLASASCDKTVKLWDTASWREVATFRGHEGDVLSVSFSPDQQRLASGDSSGKTLIWNVDSGECEATLVPRIDSLGGKHGSTNTVTWSADGKLLVTVGSGQAWTWDTNDWQQAGRYCDGAMNSFAFSPDRKHYACNRHGELAIAPTDEMSPRVRFFSGGLHVQKVAFSSDGRRLFSCGSDGLVRIWGIASYDYDVPVEVQLLVGDGARLQDLALAPDGKTLATAGFDGCVGVWNLARKGGSVPILSCRIAGRFGYPTAVALSPDLRRCTIVDENGQIATWDTNESAILATRDVSSAIGQHFTFARDADTFVTYGGESGPAMAGSVHGTSVPMTIDPGLHTLRDAIFSGDDRTIAALGTDNLLRSIGIDDRGQPRVLDTVPIPMAPFQEDWNVARFAVSTDGRQWAIANEEPNRICDLRTGHQVPLTVGGIIRQIVFSPDGRLLAAHTELGVVHLIDADTGSTLHTLRSGGFIAFSPDSQTIAIGTGLWSVDTGLPTGSLQLGDERGQIIHMQFSANGKHLAAVTSTQARDGTHTDVSLYIW